MTDSRWSRWAAIAGLLFIVFFVVSFFATHTPSTGSSVTKIFNYYSDHKTAVNISGLLTYLAVFAGGWFYVYLYRYYRSFARMEVPAVVSLVGAIIFAVSGALSAGLDFTFTDHTKELAAGGGGALLALNNLQSDLTYPMTIVGLALFFAASGLIIRKARAFPQWLAWVSWVIALVALVPPVAIIAFFATPVWTLIVVFLLWRMPVESVEPAPVTAAGA